MQMLPVPPSPPSSSSSTTTTSTDNDYVDISTLSTQIESLGLRLNPIIGNSVSSNRDTNVGKISPRPKPSRKKNHSDF